MFTPWNLFYSQKLKNTATVVPMAGSGKNFYESRYKRNYKRRRTLISTTDSERRELPAYFLTDPEGDVPCALEAIETDVMLGKPVRWENLLPVIRGIGVCDESAPDCLNFSKALLGLFERHQCRDMPVIYEVFRLLTSLTQPAVTLRTKVVKFEKFFCIPYGKEKADIDFVFDAAKYANVGLLKLQLKFGMGMMLLPPSAYRSHIDVILRKWPTDGVTREDEVSDENPTSRRERMRRIEATIKENLLRNFNPESMKRLGLVLRILVMLLTMKFSTPNYTEYFIQCYRLLFDAIPEAFVASIEVNAVLEKCLPASSSRLISKIVEDFKNLLPELAEVPQPRFLKHLCRIQVRQSLRLCLNLPHGASSLPLPTNLKDYIVLNDDGDYSIVTNSSYRYHREGNHYFTTPESRINIPESDDYVTSFIKNV